MTAGSCRPNNSLASSACASGESGGQNFIGSNKGDSLWRWQWSWQRTQERRATIVQFPSQQHRVVFMDGVVAVLHEHASPVAELHGKGHAAGRTQAVDVFTAFLPGGNVTGASISGK